MNHAWQTNGTQQLRRGKHDDAHISKHEGTSYLRLHRAEWLLAAESEPPVGAHVVTQRGGYTHHGIYVGASQVVHYAGLARGLRRGAVEEISRSGAIGVLAASTVSSPAFAAGAQDVAPPHKPAPPTGAKAMSFITSKDG